MSAAVPVDEAPVDATPSGDALTDGCRLAVLGVSYDSTEDSIRAYFSKFGEVAKCTLMLDRDTGRSRGYAFVNMGSPEMVENILGQAEHELDGRQLDVKKAVPKGEEPPKSSTHQLGANSEMRTNKLFIGRLQPHVTAEILREKFEVYGPLTDSYVPKDHHTGASRGFGFVTFENMDDADKAFHDKEAQSMDGQTT